MSQGVDRTAPLFCEGEPEGSGELSNLRKLVHAVALLEMGDAADADDITQEVFRRALASAHTLEDPRKLRSWLLSITRHYIADERKRMSRHSMDRLEVSGEVASKDRAGDPETAAILRERRERIRRVIASLPENFRLPVAMRILEERSYREIAETLDVPMTSVKNALARGGRLLVERLRNERERMGEPEP